MPDFPIVDAHVHLYDPARLTYAWMANAPAIQHAHLPADFKKATAKAEIEAYVFVEVWVDDPLQGEEARWVADIAQYTPALKALVPSVALERGHAVTDELAAIAALPGVTAVRRLIEWEADPDFCVQPDFLDGVRLLAEHDLGFDICIKDFHLPNAARMVAACPDVRFVLDHIGKPPIKAGQMKPWMQDIAALAESPNVVCKLSGIITEADHSDWKPDDVRPYVEHAIEVFGFDRLMYGSDWPVSDLTHSYETWIQLLDDIVADATETERRQLFRDNAVSFYRLNI